MGRYIATCPAPSLELAPAGELMFFLTRAGFFRFASRCFLAISRSRTGSPSLRRGSPSLRRGYPSRSGSPSFLRWGYPSRSGSLSFSRDHLNRSGSPSLRLGSFNGATRESLLPSFAVATMVPIIKILVIPLTITVAAPIGIPLSKSLPVLRTLLIPRIPLRRIPIIGSYNIDRRISVIRGPSISIAIKIIQHAI